MTLRSHVLLLNRLGSAWEIWKLYGKLKSLFSLALRRIVWELQVHYTVVDRSFEKYQEVHVLSTGKSTGGWEDVS